VQTNQKIEPSNAARGFAVIALLITLPAIAGAYASMAWQLFSWGWDFAS
jgi:hypothetical protein